MYDFRTRLCDLLDKLNGTTTLENAINDQVYLKLKKKIKKKWKGISTPKNTNELLKGRWRFINAFESGIFPMKTVNGAVADGF